MKAYGLPRYTEVEAADVSSGRLYALKTSKTSMGQRSAFKSSAKKRRVRRMWKRKSRAEGKMLAFWS